MLVVVIFRVYFALLGECEVLGIRMGFQRDQAERINDGKAFFAIDFPIFHEMEDILMQDDCGQLLIVYRYRYFLDVMFYRLMIAKRAMGIIGNNARKGRQALS